MPIRYKVITADRRSCFVYNKHDKVIHYPKGKLVKKRIGSIGIFVFKTRQDADNFMDKRPAWIGEEGVSWKIIRVQAHGRGISLKWRPVSFHLTPVNLAKIILKNIRCVREGWKSLYAPSEIFSNLDRKDDGTMAYDSVTPLD